MTGETEKSPSGWTSETLKVLEDEKIAALERLFTSQIQRLDEALAAQDRAVVLLNTANQIAQDKFEATVERDSVKQNEFRGSLDDLSQKMATRRESENSFSAVNLRVDDLSRQTADLRSRLDIGPIGLAAVVSQQEHQSGHREGAQMSTDNLYARLTIVALIAGAIGHFIH